MTELVMSRDEFDALFSTTLDSVEDHKLSSVLLYMRDVIGERVGSRRSARRPRTRSKLTKAEKREFDAQRRAARKATYDAYLTSQTWYDLRDKILDRDSYRCLCCGSRANEVHHRSYAPKVMAGMDNSKLASVCRICHQIVHYYNDGKRVANRDVDARFVELFQKYNGRHPDKQNVVKK